MTKLNVWGFLWKTEIIKILRIIDRIKILVINPIIKNIANTSIILNG